MNYRLLFEANPHPMWVYDRETLRFIAVNEAATHHYGYTCLEFLGMTILDIRPVEDRERLLAYLDTWDATMAPARARHRKKNGVFIDVDVTSRDIEFEGRPARLVLATDVTERLALERALEQEHQQLQAVFDNAIDPILLADDEGRLVDANRAACALLGYGHDELHCMRVWELMPPAMESRTRELWRRFLEAGRASGEYTVRCKDGSTRAVECRGIANILPGLHLAVWQDLTVSKRAESALQKSHAMLQRSHDQLRRISARARSAREEHRARLSRDLHDELGQALTGFKMDVAWLTNHKRSPNETSAKLGAMSRLVDDMVDTVRRIASELRPPALDHLGLIAAIEGQLKEFERRSGVRCRLRTTVDHLDLDAGRATAVFRIVQEILANVGRHARATLVSVAIQERGRRLLLEVRDNGRGITRAALGDSKSLGLAGMHERAALLGGTLRIVARSGRGTTVRLEIPLANRRTNARPSRSRVTDFVEKSRVGRKLIAT